MHTVVVDGVEIPEALIAQEAQNHPEATGQAAWAAAGHALALRALLIARARELGLEAQAGFDEDGREETAEEALIGALLDEALEVATPTEAECRRVYDAEPSRFHGLPFETVEDRIRLHLESRAWTAAAARYAAELTAQGRARGVALTLTAEGGIAPGSLALGDFLADGAASHRLEPWLAATDPEFAQRLRSAAEAAREGVADFVQAALAEFVEEADDERWTKLISAVRDAEDPALACIAAVVRSKIAPAKRSFTVIRRG